MGNAMTPERAIESIKEHNRIHFEKEKGKCPIITEALQMAISALEYRTPKKPVIGDTFLKSFKKPLLKLVQIQIW